MGNDRNSFTDAMGVVGTMLFGALIGAAVALLMAPKSGAELREDLKEGAGKMGEQLSDVSQRATERVRSEVQKIGEQAEKYGAHLGDKIEGMGDRAEGMSEQV